MNRSHELWGILCMHEQSIPGRFSASWEQGVSVLSEYVVVSSRHLKTTNGLKTVVISEGLKT